MTDPAPSTGPAPRHDETQTPRGAAERLRAAREAQGLSLADIAARTRVPIRHLEAIESGDYRDMPTPTYAIGFAKAYARAVGEDEAAIGRDVRAHTAAISAERQEYQPYELDDPTRVPPRGLAIVAGAIAVVVLIVALIWIGSGWFGGGQPEATQEIAAAPVAAPTPPATVTRPVPVAGGQVTLTALDRVWVRVHDSAGKTLFENTMKPGDIYQLPAGVDHPELTVGRPDQLRVSLNGTALPPLGSGARPLKDVPIDPAALAARQAAAPVPEATPTPPAPTATSSPAPAPTAAPKPRSTPSPRPTHASNPKPAPSKTPEKLNLKPSAPPLPPPTGIY
ncbi:MAG TPA: RodZ domain-containing protein [Sphingomonas sp.]|nr:RodZ domain-containing protein [Sphingomonas sp.]